MKIAWLIGVDITLNDLDSTSSLNKSGGWNNTQLKYLSECKSVEKLIIISIFKQKKARKPDVYRNLIVYHLNYRAIEKRVNASLIKNISSIIDNEKPDIIDIQGSEQTYSSIVYMLSFTCPVILTLHGIAFQCFRFYNKGLSLKSILFYRTFAEFISCNGLLEKNILMKRRAEQEKLVFENIKYVRGRTNWDHYCVYSINNSIKYFSEELILRESFYSTNWIIEDAHPHRIIVSQSYSPLKTLYTLLDSISILKDKYDDIELIVPGISLRKGFFRTFHDKLISKRIKELNLENYVKYTGNLNAEQMAKLLSKSRVFVLQSVIENSPQSLVEAQLVGTPCLATLTGGTQDYIEHGKTGYLYNSYDPVMAAMYIEKLFENDSICKRFSNAAKSIAQNRHDPKRLTQALIKIYKYVIDDNNQ